MFSAAESGNKARWAAVVPGSKRNLIFLKPASGEVTPRKGWQLRAASRCALEHCHGNLSSPGTVYAALLMMIMRKETFAVLLGEKNPSCLFPPLPRSLQRSARAKCRGGSGGHGADEGHPVPGHGSGEPVPRLQGSLVCWKARSPADTREVHARPGNMRIIAYTFVKDFWLGFSERYGKTAYCTRRVLQTVLHSWILTQHELRLRLEPTGVYSHT